jgi:hypothetical protein
MKNLSFLQKFVIITKAAVAFSSQTTELSYVIYGKPGTTAFNRKRRRDSLVF